MVLPLFLLIADIGAWVLALRVSADGDSGMTTLAVLLAFAILIWFAVELYQLAESFQNRGQPDSGGGE